MKPLHVAVLAAAVAVGLVAFLMMGSDDDRSARRSGVERGEAGEGRGGAAGTVKVGLSGGGEPEREGTLALTVAVLGPDGKPASGAEVALSGRLDARGGAGADGVATIDRLPPGLYDLVAKQGRAVGSVSFELKEDRDLGTLRLAEAVAIRGTVYDARRKPVQGAVVEATVAAAPGGFDLTMMAQLILQPESVAARAHTGEDGAYELLVARGGRFGLRVSAADLAPEGEPARAWTTDTEGLDFYLFPGAGLSGRVADRAGRPVVGARVLLLDPMAVLAKRIPKQETTTGEDGSFSLSANPGDETLLVVRATGYATWMDGGVRLPQYDLSIVLESGVTVKLQAVRESDPQQPAPDVNALVMFNGSIGVGVTGDDGILVLENLPRENTGAMGAPEQAVFLWGGGFVPQKVSLGDRDAPPDGVMDAGRVEMAEGGVVRGRVLNKATGEPVADAELRSLGGQSEPELDFYATATTKSGQDGTYEMRGVPLGATTVIGTHPDYVSTLNPLMMGMARGGGPGAGGQPLFASGSREARFDVELTPAATIVGQVVAPDGTPVAGAQVTAKDPMMMMMAMFGGGAQPATTDAEGRFELGGLQRMQGVPVVATHRDWGSSRPRTARAGGEPVTLELTAPLQLKGKVVDETGAPVENVRVTVERAEAGESDRTGMDMDMGFSTRPTITDAEGRYLVPNAPAGEVSVGFDHPEYIPGARDVLLRDGSAEHAMEPFTLKRGATIAGVVVDPDDQPLAHARISVNAGRPRVVEPETAGGDESSPGRTWGNVRSDAEGRFAIHGLAESVFTVDVSREGWFHEPVEVAAGTKDLRIALRPAGAIRGRVVDGFAQPVAGAQVHARVNRVQGDVTFRDHIGWARTGPDGGFALRSIPTDRPVTIEINHDSYTELEQENVRASDQEMVFTLRAGVRIAGIVVDKAGAPVANAQVQVNVIAQGARSRSVTTAADGTFEAGGLGEGRIEVSVQESGLGLIETKPIEVAPGARDIRIVVETGQSIRGVVLDAAGKPTSEVMVMAIDEEGSTVAHEWLWNQSDGAFELRGLPPGTYEIKAYRNQDHNRPEAQAHLTGVAAGATGLRLQLPQ